MTFRKKIGPPILAVLLAVIAWEALVALFNVRPWMLPAPSAILREAIQVFPRIQMHAWATLKIALYGFALSVAVGFALSVLMHAVWPKLKAPLYPLIIISQNVPIIAVAPLIVVWFGWGFLPKVLIVAVVCFFPVLVSALQGYAYTDRAMLNYMRMLGATRMQIFFKLELPYALPQLFAGLKVTATYSMMGAVISEWLGAERGLGQYMRLQMAQFRADRVFVAILAIITLSLLFFGCIAWLEKRVIRWTTQEEDA